MANKIKEKKNTFTPLTIVLLVFLCIYCLSLFYLLAWGIFTSFKVNDDVFREKPAGFFVDYLSIFTKWKSSSSLDDIDKASYLREALANMGDKDWL